MQHHISHLTLSQQSDSVFQFVPSRNPTIRMFSHLAGKFLAPNRSPPRESEDKDMSVAASMQIQSPHSPTAPRTKRATTLTRLPLKSRNILQDGEQQTQALPPPPNKSEIMRLVNSLNNDIKIKDFMLQALAAKIERLEGMQAPQVAHREVKEESPHLLNSEDVQRRKHEVVTVSHVITDRGRAQQKLGTRGSVCTANVLEAMPDIKRTREQLLGERFLRVFQNPTEFIRYLSSEEFCHDLAVVCQAVGEIFESEPRCVFLQSPVYVFGDIHGNLEDLHFFADNIWKLGMDLTAGKFLFLGDYVDRGQSSLECVAYLFGLKLLYPTKIHLLRGNHETRDVNGWEEHYQEKSFLFQCKKRFGPGMGEKIWEEINRTFDRLPLSAVIDQEIFCIHGGIPRPVPEYDTEVQAILAVPAVAAVMPAYEHETEWTKQVTSDCIWSDPASEVMERTLDKSGFGDSPRGGGAVCFGSTAIENFLENNALSYIIRAHEAHAHGVSLSKGARVFTVFSTSKDHRQGSQAMAGCILVDFDKIQVINRSPKYKNKYVHRRGSVSLDNLSLEEIAERQKLGLVRLSISMGDTRSRGNSVGSEGDDGAFNHFPAFKA